VKIDVQLTDMPLVLELPQRYKPHRVAMVAEKVETREVFDATRKAGYTLFQGYYFARPSIITARRLSGSESALMRLLDVLLAERISDIDAVFVKQASFDANP